MSEQMNNQDGRNMEPQSNDLDALFGAAPQIDLGDMTAPVQQPAAQPQAVPMQPAQQPAVPPQVVPVQMVQQPAAQPQAVPIQMAQQPTAQPQATPIQQAANVVDLFGAVVADSDAANAAALLATLANKPPVFECGSIKDDITDPNMTFEQLRVKMADDLPELEVKGHVSWSVSYGNASERISDPDKTTIFSVKSKIEQSKKFKDALKTRKKGDKEPACAVKPTVTAQKKGVLPFPSYKGMYDSTDKAEASGKAISYVPAQNGKIYELRRNEIGTFVVPARAIRECEEIGAGFQMSLPLIPAALIGQIISFFRAVSEEFDGAYEALVNVLWDRRQRQYTLHVPPQRVGAASVETDLTAMPNPARYLHVMDVHSHNMMAARFSAVDDADEQATRLYMVIGRLDKYYPDIRCRFACGGQHAEIQTDQIVARTEDAYNPAWLTAIFKDTEKEAA